MPKYEVSYFDARGRAEVIRLLLTFADQKFEDNRLAGEKWTQFKPSTPFGQMPVIHIDGEIHGQTVAIANHLAREYGLYGKTGMDAFKIDQVVCLVGDFFTATVKTMMEKDEAKKAELMKKYSEEECPKYLGLLEGLLKKNGKGFFVGDNFTLADIFTFDFIWSLNNRSPDTLKAFPLVKAHLEKVGSVPKIKAYVDARPQTNF